MKIKNKMFGSYIIILLLLIVLVTFTLLGLQKIDDATLFIQQRVMASVKDMGQVKIDIIQIQQWLTDASVTGYLDGFDIAKEHFDNANELIDKDIERKRLVNKLDLIPTLEELKAQLVSYYEVGVEMAHQYIDNGQEAGNIWMDKFDPIAETLTVLAEQQTMRYNNVFNGSINSIIKNQENIVKAFITFSLIILTIIILIVIYIYQNLYLKV